MVFYFLNITEIISCIYCYGMVICKSRGQISHPYEHYPLHFHFPQKLEKEKKDNPFFFYLLCRKYRDIICREERLGRKYGRK